MDPKQTEGQNSGSGTLSTGANISRTMDALNVNERKSATSNSPFAKHHFDKVAPGTGDILIDPSAGSIISSAPAENKGINRGRLIQFGLIFGGIALIALVIFTVVMVINNQPKGNSSSSSSNNSTPTIVTNSKSFYSYILNGDTSGNNIPTERASNKTYALTAALESGGDELSDYFAIADKAFQSADLNAISELADGQLLIEDYNFLSAYAASPLPSISELTSLYASSGENIVQNLITSSYEGYDKETTTVKYYIEMAENYSKAFINSMKQTGASSITNEVTTALTNIDNYILGIADIVEDLCISINQEEGAVVNE